MRVFQAGNRLCFGLKATNESGIIGVAAADDLDGNFAPNRRLNGAMDNAIRPSANLILQFVAPYALFLQ